MARVIRVIRVTKVIRVIRVIRGIRVIRVVRVSKIIMVIRVIWVSRVIRVIRLITLTRFIRVIRVIGARGKGRAARGTRREAGSKRREAGGKGQGASATHLKKFDGLLLVLKQRVGLKRSCEHIPFVALTKPLILAFIFFSAASAARSKLAITAALATHTLVCKEAKFLHGEVESLLGGNHVVKLGEGVVRSSVNLALAKQPLPGLCTRLGSSFFSGSSFKKSIKRAVTFVAFVPKLSLLFVGLPRTTVVICQQR
jgi:hypothetical protein